MTLDDVAEVVVVVVVVACEDTAADLSHHHRQTTMRTKQDHHRQTTMRTEQDKPAVHAGEAYQFTGIEGSAVEEQEQRMKSQAVETIRRRLREHLRWYRRNSRKQKIIDEINRRIKQQHIVMDRARSRDTEFCDYANRHPHWTHRQIIPMDKQLTELRGEIRARIWGTGEWRLDPLGIQWAWHANEPNVNEPNSSHRRIEQSINTYEQRAGRIMWPESMP